MRGYSFIVTNLVAQDLSTISTVQGSSYITFVRATHLVCHRLISSWKSDLSTSLAALELLKGLAKANIQHKGNCKVRGVKLF